MNNTLTPPHLAEALDTLWQELQTGKCPEKVEIELEDNNSIIWDVRGLVEGGKEFGEIYHLTSPQGFGLPEGSTYADLARQMDQMILSDVEKRMKP